MKIYFREIKAIELFLKTSALYLIKLLILTSITLTTFIPIYSADVRTGELIPFPESKTEVSLSKYLVDTSWLIDHIDDSKLVILDSRGMDGYIEGHIPGAIPTDMDIFLNDPSRLNSPKAISNIISGLGIDKDSRVIIYDDGDGLFASFIFWTLEYSGLDNIAILNGGLSAWKKDGQPLEKDVRAIKRKPFHASLISDLIVDTSWISQNLDNPYIVIIDVRSPFEYSGRFSLNKRKGHISGAINIPWRKNLNINGDSFKGYNDLLELYRSYGVRGDKGVVIYAQSLLRATHTYFVLTKILRYQNVRLYPYFKEWADR